jgi:hypothetical protein
MHPDSDVRSGLLPSEILSVRLHFPPLCDVQITARCPTLLDFIIQIRNFSNTSGVPLTCVFVGLCDHYQASLNILLLLISFHEHQTPSASFNRRILRTIPILLRLSIKRNVVARGAATTISGRLRVKGQSINLEY